MYQLTFFVVLPFSILAVGKFDGISDGGCNCCVMKKNYSNPPILEQELQLKVDCSSKGDEMCQELCIALAQGIKEKAPFLICEKLQKTVINLELELYSRTCNDTHWKPCNLENIEPLCCAEGLPIICGLV